MDDGGKSKFKTFYFFYLLICLCLGDDGSDPRKVCRHVPHKKINTAFLTVFKHDENNIHNVSVKLNTISTECYTPDIYEEQEFNNSCKQGRYEECDLQLKAMMDSHHNMCTVLVDSRWNMKVSINSDDKNVTVSSSCRKEQLSTKFMEGGNYTIIVMIGKKLKQGKVYVQCGKLVLENNPVDSNIPIYVAMGSFVGLIILWWFLKYLYRNHLLRKLQSYLRSDNGAFIDHVAKKNVIKADFDDIKEIEKPSSQVKQYSLRRRKNRKYDSVSVQSKNDYAEQDLGVPTNTSEEDALRPRKERLKSLDTFRGISIVIMIFVNYRGGDYWFFRHSKWNGLTVADLVFPCFVALISAARTTCYLLLVPLPLAGKTRLSLVIMCFVNYGGGQYWFFDHSDWNGITVADLVMPWFVWIMGTAMAYSFHSQLRRSTPKSRMFWKILKRSCILFALGLLINSSDGLNPVRMREFRIPGVLQRFAGTYLIIATIHMFFAKPNDPNQYTWWSPIRDITDYWLEWLFNILLVIIWLAITFGMPVPGCPKGYLGPGGLANDGINVSLCTGGAASYIDRVIFGEGRIYQTPTCREIYLTTVPHDPEGLLGILTSCFMCFLGLQAGKILRTFPDWKARVKRFIFWGIILGAIAAALCKGEKNGGFIPINKNLWSLSFVICLSSFAFFLFSVCYVTIDVYKIWSGAPFYYPGMNAILLYLGHEMINQPFLHFWGIKPNSHMVYLPINIWDTAVWIILSYFLYYKDIFFSV